MERLEFEDIAALGNLIYGIATDEEAVVTAVLFYDCAQELLKWLLQYDGVEIGHIDFEHEDYGYSKEYYITLDSDLILDIEPAHKEKYLPIDTDVLLLDGDASSKLSTINGNCLQFELVIADDDECDCENCEAARLSDLIDYITSIVEM